MDLNIYFLDLETWIHNPPNFEQDVSSARRQNYNNNTTAEMFK